MIRLGLCCIFREEPIRFRITSASHLGKFPRQEQLARLGEICLHNCHSLVTALEFVRNHDIGAFRITSPLLPRYTHPEVGYTLEELPNKKKILDLLARVRHFRKQHNLRLGLHPDQFILLSSPRPEVVDNSFRELEYHGLLAELTGTEGINIHGGGAYGDKEAALDRFRGNFRRLSPRVQQRLTLENDDRVYTVLDLLPICEELRLPLVYDVHHHRCNPDGLSEEEATRLAQRTWTMLGREPWFHVSSPKNGWDRGNSRPHADYVNPSDFPSCWLGLNITVDVEAKAKELAVLALKRDLQL